ncbi:cellulose synthase-like protein E1 [Impatiens glandulifera]|uniref:cellulose synthase-like protein E1 n=1 Tax=Impatiens glandulifera TaxID=253017 RepID=UPI001FB0EC5F|nr:cellulose synthase-like protein E1 [Impatiens glandulifera]
MKMKKEIDSPLFESRSGKGRTAYKIFAASEFLAICYICVYRLTQIPAAYHGRWAWVGLSMAELWFVISWFLFQFSRWNPVYNKTFKDRLSHRYEKVLPGVDVFVCTADHVIEPPIMVVNTVLSVMAYDYPPEKLTVYISDDACSELTFYALLEASKFAKHWLPFCNKFNVEPRSPEAYFSSPQNPNPNPIMDSSFEFIKNEYEKMKDRIESASMHGKVPSDSRQQHTAFRQWDKVSSRHDHPTILQILIDGNSQPLPTLVYLAREKNPKYHHNFKAGTMNALIRVSSNISNGSIILNVDCDMYSNNSQSLRDMLCFFLDNKGKEIAYVQFSQYFFNLTKNDLYGGSYLLGNQIELPAMDGNGGPCYTGSACFHRRDTLCGLKYEDRESVNILEDQNHRKEKQSIHVLEETSKILANCTYEDNTQWGKEIGVLYGCPTEDVVTGANIQSKGWKSKYFNPPDARKGFLGAACTTLLHDLVQNKRWSEGNLMTALSKWSPLFHGGKLPVILRLQYSSFNLWCFHSFATLYYVTVPSFCLLQRISLFPEISSRWVIPFAYAFLSSYFLSLGEFLTCGGTLQGWWNEQRMWVFRRTTSYFFGFIDSLLSLMGVKHSGFVVTPKVSEDEVKQRYMKDVMEFGASSPMLIILATIAMFNLYSFGWRLNIVLFKALGVQILLSGMIVLINLPVYEGLFFRKDNGKMPFSVTCKSVILSLLACAAAIYLQ